MSWIKYSLCLVLFALQACGGGSGGNNSSEPDDVFDAEQVRRYQVGDIVEFSGTLSRSQMSAAAVLSDVVVRVEFLDNVYSNDDKDVLMVKSTMTVTATAEEVSRSVHVWQEANGALFDLNDEYGNYYMDSASNEYGVSSFPVPLVPFEQMEYQFYTMSGGHTSTPLTMGSRSIRVGEQETVSSSAGSLAAYPVQRDDDYSWLVTFDIHKRDEVVVDELTQWVSPPTGVVKISDTKRTYSPTGALESTVILEVEATQFNF